MNFIISIYLAWKVISWHRAVTNTPWDIKKDLTTVCFIAVVLILVMYVGTAIFVIMAADFYFNIIQSNARLEARKSSKED
jgi:uncharacterized membrane protein (DUF485 family)